MLILENAYYSVISPEGCAAILWKDRKAAAQAAAALKITGRDLLEFKLVDEVIPEPDGGAHHDPPGTAAALRASLIRNLEDVLAVPGPERLRQRYQRFRGMGHFAIRSRVVPDGAGVPEIAAGTLAGSPEASEAPPDGALGPSNPTAPT